MINAETVIKDVELTDEQQRHVTRIQTTLVGHAQRILEPLSEKVKQACEDMDKLGIPEHRISFLVCQCGEDMGVSERHLRRLIPSQFKDPNQVAAAMAHHDGGHMSASTNPKTLQVMSKEDIELPVNDSSVKTDLKYGRKEFETLKVEFENYKKSQKSNALNKRISDLERAGQKLFEENKALSASALKAENDILRKKNDRMNSCHKILIQVHDSPDLSDQMLSYTIKDFVNNQWYPKYGEEARNEIEQLEAEEKARVKLSYEELPEGKKKHIAAKEAKKQKRIEQSIEKRKKFDERINTSKIRANKKIGSN